MTAMFVNLPVTDLERSKAFYTAIGFTLNPAFSDHNAACFVVEEDHSYVMILMRDYFQTFTDLPLGDPAVNPSVSTAIFLDSRDSVDAAMGRALVDMAGTPELRELANLISAAAASAFERPEGRPLFAGIAGIPWPEAPHAQIWLGMHALREFRGDAHVAVLTANGLTGLEALVLHAAMGLFPPDLLRSSRAWPQEMWDETVEELREFEDAGLDIVLLPEAYTFDSVSQLGYIAARTERLQICSSILNIYSRTPTLLAMTAAGLDYVSDGRFVLGIGASGPQVVEGFHGVKYDVPLARTREVAIGCRRP